MHDDIFHYAPQSEDPEFLDDQERYLKIALRLEPNDPIFLQRNQNANL